MAEEKDQVKAKEAAGKIRKERRERIAAIKERLEKRRQARSERIAKAKADAEEKAKGKGADNA